MTPYRSWQMNFEKPVNRLGVLQEKSFSFLPCKMIQNLKSSCISVTVYHSDNLKKNRFHSLI